MKGTKIGSALTFLLLGTLSVSAVAQPSDEKIRCLEGYEGAQEALKAQNLVRARELAESCSAEICHELMRESCVAWAQKLAVDIPSVIVRAVDESGKELAGVSLTIDDRVELSGGGRALELDPGTHGVRGELSGYETTTLTFHLGVGEKNRAVDVVLRPKVAVVSEKPRVDANVTSARPPLWPAFAFAGVGAVGFTMLGVFGSSARSADTALAEGPDACAATLTCDPARIDAIERDYLLANVGLAVGIAGGAAALGWGLFTLSRGESGEKTEVSVGPQAIQLRGRF
jgi:hypothetical protein